MKLDSALTGTSTWVPMAKSGRQTVGYRTLGILLLWSTVLPFSANSSPTSLSTSEGPFRYVNETVAL